MNHLPLLTLTPDIQRLLDARHHDPFTVLGRHKVGPQDLLRVHRPSTREVFIAEGRHWHAYRFLGAHPHEVDGVAGVLFPSPSPCRPWR